jgi:cyclophilin family peptidyl-prolyl cis-trans isomerase/HEAT repeat protein
VTAVRGPLALLAAAVLLSCALARSPRVAPAATASAPPQIETLGSPEEACARLLMLEDERRYDAPILGAAVRSGEAVVRERAAHALGSIGDSRALALLELLGEDSEASVRAASALGFEILGDPNAVPALSVLLRQQDSGVGCAAARALARLHQPGGETTLIAAYPSVPLPGRPCVLYALASFATEPAASMARLAASEASGELRRAAVYAFSRNPVASSAGAIEIALRDSDPDSAAFAARALGVLGNPDGLPALAAALERPEPGVLANSLSAIEQIEAKKAAPISAGRVARIVALAADANPNVAIPALTALRRFTDDREAIRALNAQASSGVGRRREVALVSIVRGLKEKARPKLELAIGSENSALRAAAAESLAGLAEDFSAPYRGRLLTDPSPRVREIALDAVPADASHRDAIRAMLADPDAGVRSAAIDRLADLGDPAIAGDLGSALAASRRDAIVDAALSAVSGAARFSTAESRAVVTAALSDPRPLVSRFARQQLIEAFHADPSAIPAATFSTGRTLAEYERILEAAGRPRKATIRTARGSISIALDGRAAPLTVENFVSLASRRFFDGTTFDRVVPNFVIQGGDPTATQHGGPGYEIRDELQAGSYDRGSVGMALGGPDTGGSQFFVTLSPQPHLNGRYPLFGRVTAGQDTVERIEQGDRVMSIVVEIVP